MEIFVNIHKTIYIIFRNRAFKIHFHIFQLLQTFLCHLLTSQRGCKPFQRASDFQNIYDILFWKREERVPYGSGTPAGRDRKNTKGKKTGRTNRNKPTEKKRGKKDGKKLNRNALDILLLLGADMDALYLDFLVNLHLRADNALQLTFQCGSQLLRRYLSGFQNKGLSYSFVTEKRKFCLLLAIFLWIS